MESAGDKQNSDSQPVSEASRLIAVIVGIDHYADAGFDELACAVNDAEGICNAIERALPPEARQVVLLTSPARSSECRPPTRNQILESLQKAAQIAGPADTVLLFFAGHGLLVDEQPCLVPQDARRCRDGEGAVRESLLELESITAIFARCPSERRVMLLDCCQTVQANTAAAGADSAAIERMGRLIEAVGRTSEGWVVLMSCSPGEQSLEDPAWGRHGIFSHFVADGLRGEADLNRDGIVSLAELVQYVADQVPRQAEAIFDEARRRGVPLPPQQSQHPIVFWNGPVSVPVTPARPEKREGYDPIVWRLWRRDLWRPSPYGIPLESRARFGATLLYGLAMALDIWLFAQPTAPARWAWVAAVLGTASGLLLNASLALSSAANKIRWHTGGYRASEMLLGWHILVFLILASLPGLPGSPTAAFALGVNLFVLISLLVIFATNAFNCLVSLADLQQKNERVALRRAFVQLDQRWIHADIPNVLAMVSGHPKLYQLVALGCCLLVLLHAVYVLAGPLDTIAQVKLLRDAVLVVLIQWLVQWYSAAFRGIRGRVLSEK